MADLARALAADDWRLRDEAVAAFEAFFSGGGGGGPSAREAPLALLKLGDAFTQRLGDMNAKVVQHALEALARLLPRLGAAWEGVAAPLVPALAQCTASKSPAVLAAATACLAALPDHLDPVALLPLLATATEYANAKVLDALAPQLALLVPRCAPHAAKALAKHAVPLAHRLLEKPPPHRGAGLRVLAALAESLGEAALLALAPPAMHPAFRAALRGGGV